MEKIPLAMPFFDGGSIITIKKEIGKILKGGRLILGPYTKKFEENFGNYIGTDYAIAVNSCTTALMICLDYIDVKGKEVILPSNTFVTVANSVIKCGGNVVFADMDPDTLCLDIEDVRRKITRNTKAVITLHMLGLIDKKIDELSDLCKSRSIYLIEDASHAHGATIDKRKAGSIGFAGCFSFYPTKVMTTTLGGVITTNDEKLMKFAQSLRFFGAGNDLNEIVNMGNDWMLNEVSALLGIQQLKKLESSLNKRNIIARKYEKGLQKLQHIKLFRVPKNIRHSYYKFTVLLPENVDRNLIIKEMKKKYGIETSCVYTPCHLHPLYKKMFGFKEGMLPVTEKILRQTICLPMFAQMTNAQVDYVIKCFCRML